MDIQDDIALVSKKVARAQQYASGLRKMNPRLERKVVKIIRRLTNFETVHGIPVATADRKGEALLTYVRNALAKPGPKTNWPSSIIKKMKEFTAKCLVDIETERARVA